jgi:putative oxidoreductase
VSTQTTGGASTRDGAACGTHAPCSFRYVTPFARVLVGGLFLFAASIKLGKPQDFVESVLAFKIFAGGRAMPDHLAQLATFAIPWIEALCGVLLVLGLWTRAAALLLSGLIAAFIVALILVLRLPGEIECGCFGKFEVPCGKIVGPCHVVRNSVLLALTLLVLWRGPGVWSVDYARGRRD